MKTKVVTLHYSRVWIGRVADRKGKQESAPRFHTRELRRIENAEALVENAKLRRAEQRLAPAHRQKQTQGIDVVMIAKIGLILW